LAHATFNEIQQEISHGFAGVGDREVGRMDERAANWIGGSINSGFAQNIGVGGTRMTCVELRLDIIRCSRFSRAPEGERLVSGWPSLSVTTLLVAAA
jgi:hypothetical protein